MTRLVPLLIALGCAPEPEKVPDPGPPPLDEALQADLQTALDEARAEIWAPGATAAIWMPNGTFGVLASGQADRDTPTATAADHRFRIGSITKTFVAATALTLHDEGLLDLDAPVSDVLPELPFADRMTLRQNLHHMAGWDDYAWQGEIVSRVDQPHAPEELIGAVDDALLFEPGTDFEYSNTGYVVVGLAIQAVTGEHYAQAVADRMLDPLGLDDIAFPTHIGEPDHMARGYLGGAGGGWVDVTDRMDPSVPWASGEVISGAADVATWGRALYAGEALEPHLRDQLLEEGVTTDGTPTGYALATYLEALDGRPTVGHSGSTQGYQSRLRVIVDGDRSWTIAVLINNFAAEADVIDAALWRVLDDHGELP